MHLLPTWSSFLTQWGPPLFILQYLSTTMWDSLEILAIIKHSWVEALLLLLSIDTLKNSSYMSIINTIKSYTIASLDYFIIFRHSGLHNDIVLLKQTLFFLNIWNNSQICLLPVHYLSFTHLSANFYGNLQPY